MKFMYILLIGMFLLGCNAGSEPKANTIQHFVKLISEYRLHNTPADKYFEKHPELISFIKPKLKDLLLENRKLYNKNKRTKIEEAKYKNNILLIDTLFRYLKGVHINEIKDIFNNEIKFEKGEGGLDFDWWYYDFHDTSCDIIGIQLDRHNKVLEIWGGNRS